MKKRIFIGLIVLGFILVQNAKSQNRIPWITPGVVLSRINTVKADEVSLKAGKALYISTCSSCHGTKGKGDGIAAIACDPRPADHTSNYVQDEVDASLYWKISEGRGPMPFF